MEIVEQSSGYWVCREFDTELPFDSVREAQKWIKENEWRNNTTPIQENLHKIFMETCDRWSDPEDVKSYLKKIKGSLLVGKRATKALSSGKKGHVVFDVVDENPFVESSCDPKAWIEPESPAAIVLPEDVALKIVALGGIP